MESLSNTGKHAERELSVLLAMVKNPILAPFQKELIALADKFGKSGQSGGSAPIVAAALGNAVKKLCSRQNLIDITGIDSEFSEVDPEICPPVKGKPYFQNNRLSSILKLGEKGRPYFLDAIVFKRGKDSGFTGSAYLRDGSIIYSRQFIKSFPFKPKTFYIDVIQKQVAKDDWESYVKNEAQLEQVWRYYDRFK